MASPAAFLVFLLLIGNTIVAVHRSWGDAAAVIFVLASYLSLFLLFYCLSSYEAAAPGSVARDRTKISVWILTTVLTTMFSWRIAALMPWPVAAGVWLMAASTVPGGFFALFLVPRGD